LPLLSAGACCTAPEARLQQCSNRSRAAQQQTRFTALLLSIDTEANGRTDGRTLDRFIDSAPHTMRAE